MLTLKSKFSDYVEALRKAGACEDVVAIHDEMLKKNPEFTIGDLGKVFAADPKFNDGWAYWVLELMGKEMADDFKEATIALIKDEMTACQVYIKCAPILTTKQDTMLKAIYEGKLPTAEKELQDGVVTRATAEVKP